MALFRCGTAGAAGIPVEIPAGDFFNLNTGTTATMPFSEQGAIFHGAIVNTKNATSMVASSGSSFQAWCSVLGIDADGNVTVEDNGSTYFSSKTFDVTAYDYVIFNARQQQTFNWSVTIS